jgi:hypothetical protein
MKLTYQDHTPDEYEPPYFVPVDESGVGHFKVRQEPPSFRRCARFASELLTTCSCHKRDSNHAMTCSRHVTLIPPQRSPFSMTMGRLTTDHHTVSLKASEQGVASGLATPWAGRLLAHARIHGCGCPGLSGSS